MKTILLTIAVVAMFGCGATSGKKAEVTYNEFDETKVVSIQAHGGKCGMTQCLGLGAQWSEKVPGKVYLVVASFLEYKAIFGARLNVDGKIIDLGAAQVLTSLENNSGIRTSSKAFLADYSVITDILSANKVVLQIDTPDGAKTEIIKKGSETTKAWNALARFDASVSKM